MVVSWAAIAVAVCQCAHAKSNDATEKANPGGLLNVADVRDAAELFGASRGSTRLCRTVAKTFSCSDAAVAVDCLSSFGVRRCGCLHRTSSHKEERVEKLTDKASQTCMK